MLQIQLLPSLAASSLARVFCFVLICAYEHTYHGLRTQNMVNPQLSNVDVPVLEGHINS